MMATTTTTVNSVAVETCGNSHHRSHLSRIRTWKYILLLTEVSPVVVSRFILMRNLTRLYWRSQRDFLEPGNGSMSTALKSLSFPNVTPDATTINLSTSPVFFFFLPPCDHKPPACTWAPLCHANHVLGSYAAVLQPHLILNIIMNDID